MMTEKVYINGQFFLRDEAKVSVFDHGYLYGDGVFETMRAYGGQVFKLEEHLDRLFRSAAGIQLEVGMTREELKGAIYRCLEANGLTEAYIRLSVSRGPGPVGLDPEPCPEPTVVIVTREFRGYPEEMYKQGIQAIIARTRRIPPECLDPGIKSANFLNGILARLEAHRAGAQEAIMLNLEGHICEGTVSNVFWVEGETLSTPPLSAGILGGITRQTVLELAPRLGLRVEERLAPPEVLYEAPEVFLTNTTFEIMPVVQVDQKLIGARTPGRWTRTLLEEFRNLVRLTCMKGRTPSEGLRS